MMLSLAANDPNLPSICRQSLDHIPQRGHVRRESEPTDQTRGEHVLVVNRISKRYPDTVALDNVSFTLQRGEKVGLVGANGSGKSTLLRIILGQETADSGSVMWEPGATAGYMAQQLEPVASHSVADLLASSNLEWRSAKTAFEAAVARLETTSDPASLDAYADSLERFEHLGGYDVEQRMEEIIDGLGIRELSLERPVATLSGGEKTRVALGSLLMATPDLLLLDEPTNHLDLPALEWLEAWLSASPLAAIVVSHDRAFLDRTVTSIFALDEFTHQLGVYRGGYSDYLEARRRERESQLSRYRDQQEEIERVEAEVRALKNRARRTENSTINFAIRKVAKGTARRAIVQERRLLRQLDGEERIDKPEYDRRLVFNALDSTGIVDPKLVLSARGLVQLREGRRVLDGIDLDLRGGDRVWLSGSNGSGKTTLLEILAGAEPSAGLVQYGEDVSIGYLRQEHLRTDFPPGTSVLTWMRQSGRGEESAIRALLDQFLFTGHEVMKNVSTLSYGERLRLEIARLIHSGANALLLDEPTNHLDLPGIEQMQAALSSYQGPLVVVSHDRTFLRQLSITTEWPLRNGRVVPVANHLEKPGVRF